VSFAFLVLFFVANLIGFILLTFWLILMTPQAQKSGARGYPSLNSGNGGNGACERPSA
jgi:hypothetical protein